MTNKSKTKVNINADLEHYAAGRSPRGQKSYNNGDEVAEALQGMESDLLFGVADKFLGDNNFRQDYEQLNEGMLRMALGNRFRGQIRRIDNENADEIETLKEAGKKIPARLNKTGLDLFNTAVKPFVKERNKRQQEATQAA